MAYTLDNLKTDIRNYTEVSSNVLSDTVLERIIKNAELKIHRAIDTDQSVFYATSNLIINNRYVTIPADLRFIRYVQLTDAAGFNSYLFGTYGPSMLTVVACFPLVTISLPGKLAGCRHKLRKCHDVTVYPFDKVNKETEPVCTK